MDSITNVSSEEELLELLNEGKITREEYEELLETLRKSAKVNVGPEAQDKAKPAQTPGLAIAALVFSLIGPLGSIPAVICGHLALRKIRKEPALGGRGLALAGLIIGYVVFGCSLVVLFVVPFAFYMLAPKKMYLREQQEMLVARSKLMEAEKQTLTAREVIELKRFNLDNMEGIISQTGLQIDKDISSDGNGSLRIEATEPMVVHLFELDDIDIEQAQLTYKARLRTENVKGQVYLEMYCVFEGAGEFFSKDLEQPLSGTTEWTTRQTPFFLKKGENPDSIKLNLVIKGTGTVWIDDIRLLKSAASLF